MLKQIRITTVLAIAAVAFAGYAHADINTSLNTVCNKAKTKNSTELVEKNKSTQNSSYKAKLANYYAGVSCEGKTLISASSMQLSSLNVNLKAPN